MQSLGLRIDAPRAITSAIALVVIACGSASAQGPAPASAPATVQQRTTPPPQQVQKAVPAKPAAPTASPTQPAQPAAEAKEAPMQVRLVRLAGGPCEPACTEWISAVGRIDATTPGEFRKVLTKLGTRKVPVLIDSGGGVVDAGFTIGRMLRAKGLDVVVTKTAFQPCTLGAVECHKLKLNGVELGRPEAKISKCASSCAFVLAGGARRYVGPWTVVGLHEMKVIATQRQVLRQFLVERRMINGVPVEVKRTLVKEHTISTKKEEREADEKLYDKAKAYFTEMGISDAVMPIMRSAPHTSIRLLRPAELRAIGLATDFVNGEQLLMPQAATAAVAGAPGNAPVAPGPSDFAASARGTPLITGSIGTPSTAAPVVTPGTPVPTAKPCTLSPGVVALCSGAPDASSPAPGPAAATVAPAKTETAPSTVSPSRTTATDKPDTAVVSAPTSAPPAPLLPAVPRPPPASADAASPAAGREAPAEPAAKAPAIPPAAKKARADGAAKPTARARTSASDSASPAFTGN